MVITERIDTFQKILKKLKNSVNELSVYNELALMLVYFSLIFIPEYKILDSSVESNSFQFCSTDTQNFL